MKSANFILDKKGRRFGQKKKKVWRNKGRKKVQIKKKKVWINKGRRFG